MNALSATEVAGPAGVGTDASRRRPSSAPTARFARLHPSARVLAFATLLTALGTGLLLATPGATTAPDRLWRIPFWLLVIAFALAEGAALHVELRKGSHSLSLSGIALMFGVLYLSPVMMAVAYVLAAAPTLLWVRRSAPVKVVWNCALFFLEAGLVAFIVRHLLGTDVPDRAVEWLVPFAAVVAAELMSLIAVPLVIMAAEAQFRPKLFTDVARSQFVSTLTTAFTVSVAASSVADPWLVLFALAPLIGLGIVLRTTGGLAQRYRDLEQLLGFTTVLTTERGERTVDAGLTHLVQIMRCKSAVLVVDAHGTRPAIARALIDDTFVDIEAAPVSAGLSRFVGQGIVQLDTGLRSEVDELLGQLGASKIVAVRVLDEVGLDAVLVLGDRMGMRPDFSRDELRLFASMANTFSARLANDHLVERLEAQAQQDPLTGLPNRLSFEIAVTAALAAPGTSGAIIMLDLDRFKEVNDSLGHDTGDRLLIEIAERLRRAARDTDVVARLGGDEFAMLLSWRDAGDAKQLSHRLKDIHTQLTGRVQIESIAFEVGASIGAVQWPQDGADIETLLRRADSAMYEAKRNQLGVVCFEPELDADAPRRIDLSLSSRKALEREEFFIHLQPKVATADGRITGAEALLRWNHPVHGLIPPTELIPLIAHAGLIARLTRLVIRQSVGAAAMLRDAGLDIPIAVNLTARDLLDSSLPGDVARILASAGVAADALDFEITEDALIVDLEASVAVVEGLRRLGARVAIDDFGTGYSSLHHLHRLPIDELKIDRGFVDRLLRDASAVAIVKASINLARELGLSTVAEGVEDQQTLDMITRLGCGEAQGYYISRPIPPPDFVAWAQHWIAEASADPRFEPSGEPMATLAASRAAG